MKQLLIASIETSNGIQENSTKTLLLNTSMGPHHSPPSKSKPKSKPPHPPSSSSPPKSSNRLLNPENSFGFFGFLLVLCWTYALAPLLKQLPMCADLLRCESVCVTFVN
eukprot:gb/GEZJ01000092.1/.p1 GENE.gb/GEZJ01000092.1/~~gb/GEZJ01000092.1/.p1  ORF type:complete len:109 (+),score=11.55 gb/GEZJ01000092.1/:95-421(+)